MSWMIGEHRYPQVVTFWKVVEDKGTYAVVSLGTSNKDKDKNWHNSNWSFCRFVGNAYKGLDELSEKDRIVIKSGLISREPYTDKDGKKAYPKNEQITIFAWEKYVPEDKGGTGDMDTPPMTEDEPLPF
jgi:single-stranded DNA-binding protein